MYVNRFDGLPHPAPSMVRRIMQGVLVVSLIPIAAGIGIGAEAVRGAVVQARLARAVDEAALAGGRVMHDSQRDGHVRRFFEQAFPTGFLGARTAPLEIDADMEQGILSVHAQATVEATFLRLIGVNDMTVEAEALVRRPSRSGGEPKLKRASS
ncbi:hypothetical protein M2352_004406 [Azospirillum fermentarium]|uniref:hypothetical protein n=1 Tax=Azospirillum fermentarium TaxID=1233114 RepID=UPI002227659B|nr:hypothetical protein [Azospirillum fermentarium]MCW2248746.1 hypothetical protein [Azospirillum fermentarium]